MHTKQITVETDWLHEIDGLTAEKAIAYLQTLNQSHVLNFYVDGDTHGCEVVANLYYVVPMSNDEIYAQHEKHYTKEIALYEKALQENIKYNRPTRIASCEINLQRLRDKFGEIKAKYGKN